MRSLMVLLERHIVSAWQLLPVTFLFVLLMLSENVICQESYFSPYPDWKSWPTSQTKCTALGDVDGDGDLDLVCCDSGYGNKLYLNTGDTFETSPSWSQDSLTYTQSIALGDVDGDGDLDLVCGNIRSSNTLYLNTGSTFETSPSWFSEPREHTNSIALGDVDGDGDLDLVCGNFDQSNTMYVNTGGTFEISPSWSSEPIEGTRSIALGDVNGDGSLDLVCGNVGQNTLYLNIGETFWTSPSWSSGLTEETNSIALGDVDGDGNLDLVCGNDYASNTLYLNSGSTFFEISPIWSSGPQLATKGIALGDVDGDGDLDLVCGDFGQGSKLHLNTGSTFEIMPAWSSGSGESPSGISLGDVSGDGALDLVCGNWGPNTLYFNTSDIFETSPTWSLGPQNNTSSIALGDVDGDGDFDLVCGNELQSNRLYLNTGNTFETISSWYSLPTNRTTSIALGDVNGDGDLDLVCGNYDHSNYTPSNTLYLNTGGTFEASPSWIGEPRFALSVALGDIDGDGDLDLVCGNNDRNALYLNTGGTFETSPSWLSELRKATESIALGDVDGDGDLDLVCGNYHASNTLYLNAGGTFETAPSWSSEPTEYTNSIALGDVDGDGDLDLVCGNSLSSNTLYLNAGGTFETSPSWSSGPLDGTASIALLDVDGDGDLDLVCGNGESGNTLYLNTGGTFEISPTWSSGVRTATSIALEDVNGDGALDLVCGNAYSSNTLYAGITAPVFKGDHLSLKNQLPNNGAHIRFVIVEQMSSEIYSVHFTAIDVESDSLWMVAEYQHEGDPTWYPAVIDGQTGRVGPFATSPIGVPDSIELDTHLFPFDPRDIILRLRVIEIPKRVSIIQHAAPYLKKIGIVTPDRPMIFIEDTHSFPAVTLGDTASGTLQIANRGTTFLTITQIDNPTTDIHIDETFPVQVAPHAIVELAIFFAASSETGIEGSIVIHSDDPLSPVKTVQLSANVRPLEFTLANLYPAGEIQQGTDLAISVIMQDSIHVDFARVFYRESGSLAFDTINCQRIYGNVNEQYYGLIPAQSIGARGIEYFIEVYSGRFSRVGSIQRLRTRVKNMDFAVTPPAERYAMLSIPLEMEGPILGALSDDLGGVDNTKWRMWGYDDTAAAYIELPNETTTDFEIGRGYWLITREHRSIDTGPAEGLSTPTDGPFEIALAPGWSILGNPFAFPVTWDSIEVDSLSMTEALGQGVIEPLWRWISSADRYAQDVTVIEPFEAYWVLNATEPPREIVLRIPPVEGSAGAALATAANASNTENSGAWEIAIGVSCTDAGTGHNMLGVRSRALETYDSFDRAEPPMSPGKSLSLYFPHEDWREHSGRYAVDVRAASGDAGIAAPSMPTGAEGEWGHAWIFDVAKNFSEGGAGDEITLEFSGLKTIPEELEIILIDRTLGCVVDLRADDRYRFFEGERSYVTQEEARFELLVGSGEFVESYGEDLPALPTETVLCQNYPNPFNPSTIIRYELATAGRVRLKIYDVSGALVRVLEDREREPGRYEVGWDGENKRNEQVGSGVYFYVLEAPGTRIAKKMLCVK